MPDNIFIRDLARLGTFKDWKDAESRKHSPSQLSQMGFMFVYKNETGKIICTSCQFRPENIDTELDTICNQHRQFAPNCEFNISTLHNRRKLVESANKTNHSIELNCSSNSFDVEKFKNNVRFLNSIVSGKVTFQTSSDTEDVKDVNLSTDGKFYLEKIVDKIVERLEYRCMEREEESNDITLDSENNTLHPELQNSGRTGGCDTGVASIEIQQQALHPGLSNRTERRRTFRGQEHKYAPSNHCDIIDRLVDAGLYYVGPSDNVRCFYCDGGLKNFAPADDPYMEHKRNFPDCQYIQRQQPSRRLTGTRHSSHYGNLLTVRDERLGESTLDGCIDARDQVNFIVRSSRRGLLQTDHAGPSVWKTENSGERRNKVSCR